MVVAQQQKQEDHQPKHSNKQSSSIFVAVDQGKLAIRGANSQQPSLQPQGTPSTSNSSTGQSSKPSKLSFLRNPRKLFSSRGSSSSKPDVEIRSLSAGKPKSLEELIKADDTQATIIGLETKSELNLSEVVGIVQEQLDDDDEEEEDENEAVVSVQEAVAAIEGFAKSQPSSPTKTNLSPTKTLLTPFVNKTSPKMGNSCSYTLTHNLPHPNNNGMEPEVDQVRLIFKFMLHYHVSNFWTNCSTKVFNLFYL